MIEFTKRGHCDTDKCCGTAWQRNGGVLGWADVNSQGWQASVWLSVLEKVSPASQISQTVSCCSLHSTITPCPGAHLVQHRTSFKLNSFGAQSREDTAWNAKERNTLKNVAAKYKLYKFLKYSKRSPSSMADFSQASGLKTVKAALFVSRLMRINLSRRKKKHESVEVEVGLGRCKDELHANSHLALTFHPSKLHRHWHLTSHKLHAPASELFSSSEHCVGDKSSYWRCRPTHHH